MLYLGLLSKWGAICCRMLRIGERVAPTRINLEGPPAVFGVVVFRYFPCRAATPRMVGGGAS